jgi:hypothetical protein
MPRAATAIDILNPNILKDIDDDDGDQGDSAMGFCAPLIFTAIDRLMAT